MQHRLQTAGCLLACLLMASCGANSSITFEDGTSHEGNQVTVNGRVIIGAGCTIKGSCRTVNGRVSVGSHSHVESLKSVNGSIRLDDNIVVNGDLETVNGGIRVGPNVSVEGNLETVNGGVSVASGGSIQGTLRTVNGDIELDNTEVSGSLVTNNGDISLENGTRVIGNLVIRGDGGKELKPPTIIVSGTSIVQGDIEIRDKDRGVRLVIRNGGQVTGSTDGAIVERVDERGDESSE